MDTTVNYVSNFIYHHLNCYLADIPEITDFNSMVAVFPNPTANNFTITFLNYDFKPYNIELIDLMGRRILNLNNQNSKDININTNSMDAGMYFARITKGNMVSEKKIVIY